MLLNHIIIIISEMMDIMFMFIQNHICDICFACSILFCTFIQKAYIGIAFWKSLYSIYNGYTPIMAYIHHKRTCQTPTSLKSNNYHIIITFSLAQLVEKCILFSTFNSILRRYLFVSVTLHLLLYLDYCGLASL